MKFCSNCGRQLGDNEICPCQNGQQTAQNVNQQQYQQPYYQQAPQNNYQQPAQNPYGQNPYQNPYQQPIAPKQPSVFNKLVDLFKLFWKNPKKAVADLQNSKNMGVAGILAGAFALFMALGAWLTVRGAFGSLVKTVSGGLASFSDISKYVKIYSAPMLLLTGLLCAAIFGALLIAFRLLMCKLCGASNERGSFKNGFLAFSVYSIPATLAIALAILCSFFSFALSIIFSAAALVYLALSMYTDTANEIGAATRESKWLFIAPVAIFVVFGLYLFIGSKLLTASFKSLAESIDFEDLLGNMFY